MGDDLEADYTTLEFEFEDTEGDMTIAKGDVGVFLVVHDAMFVPADGEADSDAFESVAYGMNDWEASDISEYQFFVAFQVTSDAETGDYDVEYAFEELFDSGEALMEVVVTVAGGGFPLLLVLFLLAAAGGAAYYFTMM